MEKYESKQVRINRSAETVYGLASNFNNFTSVLEDKVEDWHATEDTCSFKVKGFNLSLQIAEKEEPTMIKVTGGDNSPLPFTFWMQLKEMAPDDTRMKLTLHAELPMMVKMMVGSKLREGIDQMAERIAEGFNTMP